MENDKPNTDVILNELRLRIIQIKSISEIISELVAEKVKHQDWINDNCPHPHDSQREWADYNDKIKRECKYCHYVRTVGHVIRNSEWVYD